jgi:hypothetical protein
LNRTSELRRYGVIAALLLALSAPALAQPAAPRSFATAEQAAEALLGAARHNDPAALLALFGAGARDIVFSGDPVADRQARAHFAERYGQGHRIVAEAEDRATLLIGQEEWPFPIPLLRQAGQWHFDASAG